MTRVLPPLAMTSGTPRAFPRMANLVHPTIIIAIYTYVVTPTDISPQAALIAGLAMAAVCFGAAALLYRLVERPAMNARSRVLAE